MNSHPIAQTARPDLQLEDHGSLFLFRPLNIQGKDWLKDTAPSDAQFLGTAMAVEPRYVQMVIDAAEYAGLSVAAPAGYTR